MTSRAKPSLVLVGSSGDIERLAALVDEQVVEVYLVNEDPEEGAIPSTADLVAYAWSQDSSWSTSLYSIFTYIHDFVKPNEEYIVYMDCAEQPGGVMPSLPDLPTLRGEQLTEQTRHAAALAPRSS